MTEQQKKVSKIIYAAAILAAAVLIFCVLRGVVITAGENTAGALGTANASRVTALTDLSEGWTLQDGSAVSLPCTVDSPEGSVTICRDMTGTDTTEQVLRFSNLRQSVLVTLDGRELFRVNNTSLTSQIRFKNSLVVRLPDGQAEGDLCITFFGNTDGSCSLPAISMGPVSLARYQIISENLFNMVVLAVLGVFAIGLALLILFMALRKQLDIRIPELLLFCVLTIAYGLTDSNLATMTSLPQEVVGLICYLSLMALPLPVCHFLWVSCGRNGRILPAAYLLCTANLVVQGILSTFGLFRLDTTFLFSHALFFCSMAAAMVEIIRALTSGKSRLEHSLLLAGTLLLIGFSIAAIITYWEVGGNWYRNLLMLGILLFAVLLLGIVVLHYVIVLQNDRLRLSEMKIHEKLSLYDDLTGLMNRRAFDMKMAEIEEKHDKLPDAVLITMDVNGLKIVNDNFGHSAGDDLIVSAARVISSTYMPAGSCYRIGGDEFAVVLTDLEVPLSSYDTALEEAMALQNEGSRWKLSIARGASHLCRPSGVRITISDWKQEADVNMYRNKLSMKGNHSRDQAKDFKDIIDCVITTMETRDMYTAAHSARVRELAFCIADCAGVSGATLQNVETAAYLHDIGKIAVPDSVLLKDSRLTDEEFALVRQHSVIGWQIISKAKGMQDIAEIILYHHERWNGSGYPEGLEGEAIPLESRIIALADSIDAMTSRRSYRDSMTIEECRNRLEQDSGVLFDPALTTITLENWKKIIDIILLHPKRLIKGELPDQNDIIPDRKENRA